MTLPALPGPLSSPGASASSLSWPGTSSGSVRLGRYDLLARIGQGGMAAVYLAVARGGHQDFRKLVVLKILHENLRTDASFVEMFTREAKIAAELSHPNVVHTYTVEEEAGNYYLVMEYLDGVPLNALLRKLRGKPLEERFPLLGALVQALSGLHYVHEFSDYAGEHMGLVHRDFKPANIFITFDGQVKVLDFGVAKVTGAGAEHTVGGAMKGTVQYAAPEVLDARAAIDRRADLFAAGVIGWEIVTGQRFWGDLEQLQILRGLASGDYAERLDAPPEMPTDLAAVFAEALSPNPDDRPATASDFARQLRDVLGAYAVRFDSTALGDLVRSTFGDLAERRKATVHQRLSAVEMDSSVGEGTVVAGGAEQSSASTQMSHTDSRAFGPPSTMTPHSTVVPGAGASNKSWALLAGALFLAAVGVAGVAVWKLAGTSDEEPVVASLDAPRGVEPKPALAPEASDDEGEAAEAQPSVAAEVSVVVSTDPANAEIHLDGIKLSDNPAIVSGSDGDDAHELLVRAEGYVDKRLKLRLDTSRRITVSLDAREVADPEPAEAAGPAASAGKRRRTPKRRRAQEPQPPIAELPKVEPRPPAAPRPGDDLPRSKKSKKSTAIDEDLDW